MDNTKTQTTEAYKIASALREAINAAHRSACDENPLAEIVLTDLTKHAAEIQQKLERLEWAL